MSDIENRLRASVAMGAVHGDFHERNVCESQMGEAADEIARLAARVRELEGQIRAQHSALDEFVEDMESYLPAPPEEE